jgi:hypothetical protein
MPDRDIEEKSNGLLAIYFQEEKSDLFRIKKAVSFYFNDP